MHRRGESRKHVQAFLHRNSIMKRTRKPAPFDKQMELTGVLHVAC